MPITYYHIGPALFFGFLLRRRLNVPVFLAASVILDVEPLIIILSGAEAPLHGFFHSFAGAAFVSTAITAFAIAVLGPLNWRKTLVSALFGSWTHVFLDAPLYLDIRPFYPLSENPLLGMFPPHALCILLGVMSIPLIALEIMSKKQSR